MASNQPRGTPGLLLLIFAAVLVVVAAWAWMARLETEQKSAKQPVVQEEEDLP